MIAWNEYPGQGLEGLTEKLPVGRRDSVRAPPRPEIQADRSVKVKRNPGQQPH